MGYPGRKLTILAIAAALGAAGLVNGVLRLGRSDPDAMAAQVRVALQARDWPRAGGLLARIARERPPTVDDIVLRAELEQGLGRGDAAVALLTSVPESDHRAASARLVAGQIEKSRDRARRLESLFLEAARLDPRLVVPRRELIRLYAIQARRADLNAQYRALAAIEPLAYDDVLLWTASLEDIWINETIREQLERFIAADPEDRPSRLALAGVLIRSNQLEEAEGLLRPVPEADPDARALRARIALGRSRLDEVRSMLDAGPEGHVGLALLRGQLAVRMNDLAAAERYYRLAMRGNPTDREALQGLSIVLGKRGRGDEASALRRRVEQWRDLTIRLEKARDPGEIRRDPQLMRQVAEACASVDRVAEARAWYQLALAREPLDPGLQRALYRLKGGGP